MRRFDGVYSRSQNVPEGRSEVLRTESYIVLNAVALLESIRIYLKEQTALIDIQLFLYNSNPFELKSSQPV